MVKPPRLTMGAGQSYTNALMGQSPSAAERESVRKASTQILREDSIYVEESDNLSSRPDSFSIHCDYTDQAPYSSTVIESLATGARSPHVPKENPSHELAYFLRTTGPPALHRLPSKKERPKRRVFKSMEALRFLKRGSKQRGPLYEEPVDVGGLLARPPVVQQEVSSHGIACSRRSLRCCDADFAVGKRYLSINVPPTLAEQDENEDMSAISFGKNHCQRDYRPVTCGSPSVLDSQVSMYITNGKAVDVRQLDHYRLYSAEDDDDDSDRAFSAPIPQIFRQRRQESDSTVRQVIASSPATALSFKSLSPSSQGAYDVSMTDSYLCDFNEHSPRAQIPAQYIVRNKTATSLPLPDDFAPVEQPSPKKDIDIKHPSPRRFASHPLLLQRASSFASSLYPQSICDSPGPPPRSPLRLRRDPRTIEGILASSGNRKTTPRIAPSIMDVSEYNDEVKTIKATVTTDCTGPIKRPRSRGKNVVGHPAYPASRKERELRTRAKKLGERSTPTKPINSIVNSPQSSPLVAPRQRLRKVRPQIQIPALRPAPLAPRAASSSLSSEASFKKVTQSTRVPVSPVSSLDASTSRGCTAEYSPVSPATSSASGAVNVSLSPVMLVAEQIPMTKTKSPSKPSKLIVKDGGKSYAPRPRSASMKRRSRHGAQTPSRPNSPNGEKATIEDDTPPLPSPPPNRALPPTPPASGSEKTTRVKATSAMNRKGENALPALPALPAEDQEYHTAPKLLTTLPKRLDRLAQINTQIHPQPTLTCTSSGNPNSDNISTRLENLEKQNALLSAALTAVLRTNGTCNSSVSSSTSGGNEQRQNKPKVPMSWESRIARRSAAGRHEGTAEAGGDKGALGLYMSTRQGRGVGMGLGMENGRVLGSREGELLRP